MPIGERVKRNPVDRIFEAGSHNTTTGQLSDSVFEGSSALQTGQDLTVENTLIHSIPIELGSVVCRDTE